MGVFAKLFGSKEEKQPIAVPKGETAPEATEKSITCMMLYQSIPLFNPESLENRIRQQLGTDLSSITCTISKEGMVCLIGIGKDQIMVAGLYFPYPKDALNDILQVCHFSKEAKQPFYQSQAHIILSYKSVVTPPHLQYARLYQVIKCLLEEDNKAIGVIQESAVTAHPVEFLNVIESERADLQEQKAMPFMSWLAWTGGCVKYIVDPNTIWFVTKGNHNFGLPELAYKGTPDQGNSTMELFNALFSYMYFYKATLVPGHTAELGGLSLKFTSVTEYPDLFTGKYGILVVNLR